LAVCLEKVNSGVLTNQQQHESYHKVIVFAHSRSEWHRGRIVPTVKWRLIHQGVAGMAKVEFLLSLTWLQSTGEMSSITRIALGPWYTLQVYCHLKADLRILRNLPPPSTTDLFLSQNFFWSWRRSSKKSRWSSAKLMTHSTRCAVLERG